MTIEAFLKNMEVLDDKFQREIDRLVIVVKKFAN